MYCAYIGSELVIESCASFKGFSCDIKIYASRDKNSVRVCKENYSLA